MAQLVDTQITIGGNLIKQYSSFQLTQGIFAHHTFRLVCPAESIDGTTGTVFNQSRNLMGASFTASISAVDMSGVMKFSGIVMQVETARFSGHSGDVIITGYSPTIVLDNGPHCKSWEKKAVKNIVQDVLKHFPQNILKPKINTVYPETLAYTVQYKETAWQFINRLCATYGEWLYYDGQSLVAGPPAGGQAVDLTFGSNLSQFNMALEVRPAKSQSMAYDYLNHNIYKSEPSGIENKAGLNELGKHALQASNSVYATQPKMWQNNFITNKKQLDDVVNMRAAMQSSNHVRFNGNSGQPGIQLGGQVSVHGQNVFNLFEESFGDYIIIAVSHFCDGQSNYNNDFVAIPSSIKVPPVNGITEPNSETQSAMVTDNHDPRGLGRIRVKFHWMNGAEKTPWIRVTSPHGGGGKGMFFIPEIGEEVIVGFEGDSAIKPYVIGTVYHGEANNSFSNEGNDIKMLQTRSGTKIQMNDAQGSILIEDPSGNSWLMDGQGNISVTAPEDINLNIGKNLHIDAGINMQVNIGNDLTFNVGNQALLNVFQKMLINTPILLQMVETFFHTQAGKALIHSASEIKIESPEMYIAGSQKLFLHSDESAVLNSKGIAEMKGKEKNNFNNEPTSYEVAKKEIPAKCVVHFRPKTGWQGEDCGFDWMRLGETTNFNDTKYKDIVAKQYKKGTKVLETDINKYEGDFVKNAVLYKTLKTDYTPHIIPWKAKKDSSGKDLKHAGKIIPEDYFCSWISLYPTQIEQKDSTGKAVLQASGFQNTKATVSLIIDIEEEPDYLEFEDNAAFTITPKKVEVKGKGKGNHTFSNHITIECLKEIKTDQEIRINAIKKGKTSAEDVKQIAGKFKVWSNDSKKRKKKKVVLISVITDVGGVGGGGVAGSIAGQQALFEQYLRQALIELEVSTESLDMSGDANFQPGGNYENGNQIVAYYNGGTPPAGFIAAQDYLYTKLKAQLKAANPADENKYNKSFRAYYFGENGGYIDSSGSVQALNGYSLGNSVVLFPLRNDQTASHEFLHSFGLPHSFTNKGPHADAFCTYEYHKTENLMDYSHHAPTQVRYSTWHWQWKKANGSIV